MPFKLTSYCRLKRRKIQAKKEKNAKCMALQRHMESSELRQTRLHDISAHKVHSRRHLKEGYNLSFYSLTFTLVIAFHHIIDAYVEFCFLKKEFLNLNINMQLLYFITTVTSQVHTARHHQRAGYSTLGSGGSDVGI